MESTGKVVRVCENSIYVKIKRVTACGKDCDKCIGCGSNDTLKFDNNVNVKPGDKIRIVSKENNLTSAVFYVYIIPLIVFIISYLLIFNRISQTDMAINYELFALFCAVVTMIASYGMTKFIVKRLGEKSKLQLEKIN